MREGLKLVQVPGSYYGRAVTLVGWLKRTSGDEFELHGAVMVWRTGQWAPGGLDDLAADGPDSKRYGHSKPAKMPEELHRLTLRRSKPANPEAWAKICPRPKNWEASE